MRCPAFFILISAQTAWDGARHAERPGVIKAVIIFPSGPQRPIRTETSGMSDKIDDILGEPAELFHGAFDVPYESPVQPHQLRAEDEFQFDCHPGVPCFNACCKNIEIQLTPYDILRLKRRLGVTSDEFVARYTMPFEMDQHGMPGLRMATKPGTKACVFLEESGCSVYSDRPTVCRYYALGNMGVRKKDSAVVEEAYFLVKEPHCKGHLEPKTQTVDEYRKAQGADLYDQMNREWRDIIIKKRTSGPTIGRPSDRSMQLFDMCSYDMDSFRDFIQSPGFRGLVALDPDELQELIADEEKRLAFAFRFLKQVLFGEMTIPVDQEAREARLQEARERIKRREEELLRQRQAMEDDKYENG